MKTRRMLALITLLLIAGAATADRGKMYKWTDENGVVHFSEAPPASETAETERVAIPGVDPRERRRSVAAPESEPEQDERAALAAAMAEDPQVAAEMKKNCANARRNIAVLTSQYSKVQAYDADGNPQELDAGARKARLAREQDYIQTYCS